MPWHRRHVADYDDEHDFLKDLLYDNFSERTTNVLDQYKD